MDGAINPITHEERLVCYFEDSSFSVVPVSAIIPFSPLSEPYLSYSRTVRRFTGDPGIVRATLYWRDGTVPPTFKWLLAAEEEIKNEEAEVLEQEEIEMMVEVTDETPIVAKPMKRKLVQRKKRKEIQIKSPLRTKKVKEEEKQDERLFISLTPFKEKKFRLLAQFLPSSLC